METENLGQKPENQTLPETAPKQPQHNTVALGIIAGAILVSASIFYNTNLIVKALGGAQAAGLTKTDNGQQGAVLGDTAPSAPVKLSDRSDEPFIGNANAKVVVEEFGDFQCPYCQSFFNTTLPQIKSKYIDTGKIKYVFRHFPLSQIHVNAQISAVASECANRQNKFWEYHDLLYKNGKADGTNLAEADLKKYADRLGLNAGTFGFGKNKFNECLESKASLDTVNKDQAEGSKDGVTGTPTFFVNGQKIVGAQPYSVFESAIEGALKN